ncbi:hypothetical protein LCGC14_2889190, partial [marine sediment metagenome]
EFNDIYRSIELIWAVWAASLVTLAWLTIRFLRRVRWPHLRRILLDEGGVAVLPAGDHVVVLRVDSVTAAGENDQTQALMGRLSQQLDQALAQGLFDIYSDAVMRDADPQIDQRAVSAVHVNFP